MKYYVTHNFTSHPLRGRSITAKVGDRITQNAYNRLSSNIRERCLIPARNAPKNCDFTDAECNYLVSQYCADVSQEDIIREFYELFPTHQLNGGVECQLRIIAGQDNYNLDDKGLDNPGRVLLQSMMEIDPARFVS